jgi:hypothetical protein
MVQVEFKISIRMIVSEPQLVETDMKIIVERLREGMTPLKLYEQKYRHKIIQSA